MKGEIIKGVILLVNLLGITFVQAGTATTGDVSSTLCNVVGTIKAIAAVLAVAMFVIGGILYAIGNILTGQVKQSAHGWAQGLIIGGVVAIILIGIAQPLVNLVASAAGVSSVSC